MSFRDLVKGGAGRSAGAMRLGRRGLLAGGAAGLGAPVLAADMKGFPHDPRGPDPSVRMAQPAADTVGAVWRPLIELMPAAVTAGLGLTWIESGPGISQFELVTNRVNVGGFGALGVAAARGRLADLVLFGPALLSHARWLVHGGSPFQHVTELAGRRVACPPDISESFQQAVLAAATVRFDLKRETRVVFGTPAANRAAFERQDVEAMLALEPMASDLVSRGARDIGSVAAMWREGTGDAEPLFLVGLAAHRDWVVADLARASRVAGLVLEANGFIRDHPEQLAQLHGAAAADAARVAGFYATDWDQRVFASMDRQLAAAVRLGLLPAMPEKPVHVSIVPRAG